MKTERHLVLVGSLVPLHLSAEQVQRRLLDAVPEETLQRLERAPLRAIAEGSRNAPGVS